MFAGIFVLGLVLMVCGVILFIALSVTRLHGSRTAAGRMIVVGFCLCVADYLLLLWIFSDVGA